MNKLSAEQLVEKAEKLKVGKYGLRWDNKADFGVEAIVTLVKAGAVVAKANEIRNLTDIRRQLYCTEVVYNGYMFMSLSETPLILSR